MPRTSTRTFRVYLRLLGRDVKRSLRTLVRITRRRGQLIIVMTRPRFGRSHYCYAQWRRSREREAPLRRNVAAAYAFLLVGSGVLALSLVQLSAIQPAIPKASAVIVAPQPVAKKPTGMPRSVPTHISITDIAVDTDLIQLGKNDDGTMQTPDSYEVAGWYKYSPTPGEIGPAIITGHVDNYRGAAVFFRLKELQPGQKITIAREDGSTAIFSVTSVQQFDQDHFPADAVYGNTADAQLRLITCGGPFNHLSGEYTQNTVVFAVLDVHS